MPHRWRERLSAAAALPPRPCWRPAARPHQRPSRPGPDGNIVAVGAENEYATQSRRSAGITSRPGAIMSNPKYGPAARRARARLRAAWSSAARLWCRRRPGLRHVHGHDREAVRRLRRRVTWWQKVLRCRTARRTPHLWYDASATMPKVATAIADPLVRIQAQPRRYFKPRHRPSRTPWPAWINAIGTFKQAVSLRHPWGGAWPPRELSVADYLAPGLSRRQPDPWAFQADVITAPDRPRQDSGDRVAEACSPAQGQAFSTSAGERTPDRIRSSPWPAATTSRWSVVYETHGPSPATATSRVWWRRSLALWPTPWRSHVSSEHAVSAELLRLDASGSGSAGRSVLRDVSLTCTPGEFTGHFFCFNVCEFGGGGRGFLLGGGGGGGGGFFWGGGGGGVLLFGGFFLFFFFFFNFGGGWGCWGGERPNGGEQTTLLRIIPACSR